MTCMIRRILRKQSLILLTLLALSAQFAAPSGARAGEGDLAIPDLHAGHFTIAGKSISGWNLLLCRSFEGQKFESREAFLKAAEARVGAAAWKTHGETISKIAAPTPIAPGTKVLLVLLFSVVGMGGSCWVAYYGIRVNTYANCRTAFA